MKVEQRRWTTGGGWEPAAATLGSTAQLVLVFGGREALEAAERLAEVKRAYPKAHLFGCSTAGEIHGTRVDDDSISVTAVEFARTRVHGAHVQLGGSGTSRQSGEALARSLPKDDLVHVVVLSDGTNVNGSELVQGMLKELPAGVQVTGGLSGDGARFQRTLVFFDTPPQAKQIAAIGLYGRSLKVGYGSLGGWDPFGPERLVTRSAGNVLYELDGQPALALYEKYLGDYAAGLPGTGLLFPLSVRAKDSDRAVVRTILGIDESRQSMTFAGDMPEGAYAQLMKANFDRLIDGAHGAAQTSQASLGSGSPELAILISCVGRKLVLKQRTEEELEAVQQVLGASTTMTGFYSYGEICPAAPNANCELHNQTMTITTFAER